MTHISFFMGAAILAFVLATANTTTFADSCCGAKKDNKECNMNVSAGEGSGDKCLVCGQAADSKGQKVDTKHAGETVHLCCEGCADAYNKNPDKYSKTKRHREPVKRNERTSAY